MSAHTVITHALTQGTRMRYTGTQTWDTDAATVTVVKPWGGHSDPLYVVRPDGMRYEASYVVAASELVALPGVPLAKTGDVVAPVVLVMESGQCRGWDTVVMVRVSLRKDVVCGWCDDKATRVAPGSADARIRGVSSDYMCERHAFVWGRFVPSYVVRAVPGRGVDALTLDWGFVETD